MTKLLTIAVPTYNRADCLELLLNTLVDECVGFGDLIDIIVSDNASTDRTQTVISRFLERWPSCIAIRYAENLGPDENFCGCIDKMQSKYFWIIGDDDLPKAGFIQLLCAKLMSEAPDLVYFGSEWVSVINGPEQGIQIGPLPVKRLSAEDFASKVNIWMTFISGMVVRLDNLRVVMHPETVRRWKSTSLVQLGWVYAQLRYGKCFLYIESSCILATAGNTGGYAVIKVFADNFPRITQETFGTEAPQTRRIISRAVADFLPGLIWKVRFDNIGSFLREDSYLAVRNRLSNYILFWIFVAPIMTLPKAFAWPFYFFARLVRKIEVALARVARI